MPKGSPWDRYEVRTSFRAPLGFVYRWCTDYSGKDSDFSAERFDRRILRRTPREVVFEDLYDTPQGWVWLRRKVRLVPPARWHADSLGSDREISVEYRLSSLRGDRTQLTIKARRRPYGIGTKNPSKATWERSVAANWKKLGRALEREYRSKSRRPNQRRSSGG